MSPVQTARLNEIDPWRYLREVLAHRWLPAKQPGCSGAPPPDPSEALPT